MTATATRRHSDPGAQPRGARLRARGAAARRGRCSSCSAATSTTPAARSSAPRSSPAQDTSSTTRCTRRRSTAEQWALEQALQTAVDDGVLAGPGGALPRQPRGPSAAVVPLRHPLPHRRRPRRRARPHRARRATTCPSSTGRVTVSGVFRPGDPGSYTDTMTQAFVRTDVIASGLLDVRPAHRAPMAGALMDTRTVGQSDLVVSVAGLGCNNFGMRADEAQTADDRQRRARRRHQLLRHRAHATAAASRRSSSAPRCAATARPGGHRHEVRRAHRSRRAQRVARDRDGRGRGEPHRARHRLHRPLPAALLRRPHADRGDARCAHRARRAGQGPLHRLLELHRVADRRRRLDRRDPGPRVVRVAPERVEPARARASRPRCSARATGSGSACCRTSRSRRACSPAR